MNKTTYINMIVAIAMFGLVSGCASKPQPFYTYGTYGDSYYAYKKNMTPESELALQKAMEDAISNSDQSSSGRVPPGMYANLGYMYLKSGSNAKAIANFTKEKEVYPEAAHFMDRMIKKVEIAENGAK